MRCAWLFALGCAACVTQRPSPTAGQVSVLELVLTDPAERGSPGQPVAVRRATFEVIARDEQGQVVEQDLDADVFVSFGGVRTGQATTCQSSQSVKPLATLRLSAGRAVGRTVDLPQAFGPTNLWIEERSTHVIGASPTIYFRNPYISDVQKPLDLAAPNVTFCTPFEKRFVLIDGAEGAGKLVVSSVFGNAFAITDTGASAWNSIYVFTFGRPPSYVVRGRVLGEVSGNVSKFIGFTELNVPLYQRTDEVSPQLLPQPVPLAPGDLTNIPKLLSAVSSEVTVAGAICNPNAPNAVEQWTKFNTFLLDQSGAGACDAFSSYSVQLPSKVVGSFDLVANVGKTVTIVGMLKNSSGQNAYLDASGDPVACDAATPCGMGTCVEGLCRKNPFNFWTVLTRGASDVVVP